MEQIAEIGLHLAAWIAYGCRAIMLQRIDEHALQFVKVLRGHYDQVRHTPEKGNIEYSMVGGAIFTYDAGPVDCKEHRRFWRQTS